MQERKIVNKSALNYYTTQDVSVLTNYTLKKYGKVEIKVNIFLLRATVGGEWLTSCSSNLPLRNSTQYPTDESQNQSDTHVHVRTHTLLNIQYYSNTWCVSKVSVLIFYLIIYWTYLKLQVISFEVWPLGSYTAVPTFLPLIIAVPEVIFRKCV